MKIYILSVCLCILTQTALSQHALFDNNPYTEYLGSSFDFISTVDINGDGRRDIVGVTSSYGNSPNDYMILVWLQTNSGQLAPVIKTPYLEPSNAKDMIVTDIDGQPAIVIAMSNYVAIYHWDNSSKSAILIDTFNTIANLKQECITAGDFDNDGLTDLAIGYWNTTWFTIAYQDNATTGKWDIINYATDTGYCHWHVTSGMFGSLTQDALISVNANLDVPLSVMTFTASRQIENVYKMRLPASTWSQLPASAEIVQTRSSGKWETGKKNELWLIYGGNYPRSKAAVWHDTQVMPDSIIQLHDNPGAIKSANLDCDQNHEPVILHAGWNKATVFSDTERHYKILSPSHYKPNGLALGDINNDGKNDICIAGSLGASQLTILYNVTPNCWPLDVEDIAVEDRPLFNPNPFTHRLTGYLSQGGTLRVCNVLGMPVCTRLCAPGEKIDLNTTDWQPGLYFATVESNNVKKAFRLVKL